jgi:uncharacterized protein with HEPN domain
MRPEALYLHDIVQAVGAIDRFLSGVQRGDFMVDELRQSAVLQKRIVIGEAASRLSKEFRTQHSKIEWADIVGFRNTAVHEYFDMSWRIVWITAKDDVPNLHRKVSTILAEEYAE